MVSLVSSLIRLNNENAVERQRHLEVGSGTTSQIFFLYTTKHVEFKIKLIESHLSVSE